MTEPTLPEQQYMPPSPGPLNSPQSSLNPLLLIISVVALTVAGFFAYQFYSLKAVTRQQEVVQREKMTESEKKGTDAEEHTRYVFRKDDDLWVRATDGQLTQLTTTDGGVTSYAHLPSSPLVAYVHGERITNTSDYTYILPSEATLLNLDTGESRSLLTLTPSTPEGVNTEFLDRLWDVRFSNDGKLLAITTSQKLYIYNTETTQLTEIFYEPYSGGMKAGGIFSYRMPLFSPDATKVILLTQYYEGSGYVLVDLNTKQVHELPQQSGYGGVQRVVDWMTNSQFMVRDSVESIEGESDRPDLVAVTFPGIVQETLIQSMSGKSVDQLILSDDNSGYVLMSTFNPGVLETTFMVNKFNFNTHSLTPVANLPTLKNNEATVMRLISANDDAVTYVLLTHPSPSQGEVGAKESIHVVNVETGETSVVAE